MAPAYDQMNIEALCKLCGKAFEDLVGAFDSGLLLRAPAETDNLRDALIEFRIFCGAIRDPAIKERTLDAKLVRHLHVADEVREACVRLHTHLLQGIKIPEIAGAKQKITAENWHLVLQPNKDFCACLEGIEREMQGLKTLEAGKLQAALTSHADTGFVYETVSQRAHLYNNRDVSGFAYLCTWTLEDILALIKP